MGQDASKLTTFSASEESKAYRTALGTFATGIAIVTANIDGRWIGITVNSFSSISLSPPMIMWAPDKSSRRHDLFASAKNFAVHVLSADQRHICDAFVKSADAFDGLHVELSGEGVPLLKHTLAAFECELDSIIDAGDHSIILGKVDRVHHKPGEALVFCAGQITNTANLTGSNKAESTKSNCA